MDVDTPFNTFALPIKCGRNFILVSILLFYVVFMVTETGKPVSLQATEDVLREKSINISYYMDTVRNITKSGYFGGFTHDSMVRASFSTEVYPLRLKNVIEVLLGKMQPITVLTLGGSITAGNTNCCGDLPKGTDWPARFQQ